MLRFVRNIKRIKLQFSFFIILLLFLIIGGITINGLMSMGTLTRRIYEHPLVVSNASLIAALSIAKMHRSMKDVVLANSPEQIVVHLDAVENGEATVYVQLDTIRQQILGKEGEELEKETRRLFTDWRPIRQEVVALLEAGERMNAIDITRGKGAIHVDKLEQKMLELMTYARNKATSFQQMAIRKQRIIERTTKILTGAGILLSVFIAVVTTFLVIRNEKNLQNERDKLQKAIEEIKTLQGIIPICSHCKQIRDDKGAWNQLEAYIHDHSEAKFSHSICPTCLRKHYPEIADKLLNDEPG